MKNDLKSDGVLLPDGETGSAFFHRVLLETAARFPDALGGARLPRDPRLFKRQYGDALVRFEAARIASKDRVAIAQDLAERTLASLRLAVDGTPLPLLEALKKPSDAPPVETKKFSGKPGLQARVPFEGRVYEGKDVLTLVDRLHEDHHMSDAARAALVWIVEHIAAQGGALDLSAHKFALLGAGAELSPLSMLLQGGATVLWIDVKPPRLEDEGALAGTLVHTLAGDDLLNHPRAALALVRRFAEGGPVHLGMLAYAPGQSRELRVASVMNAMAQVLGSKAVRSLSMLISPTSPGETQPEDARVAEARGRSPQLWQRALDLGRALPRPGHYGTSEQPVARAIVPLQGPGYQAAQYLAKIVTAEAFATAGLEGGGTVTVSANVAGITNTRSLSHPLFQVAFVGAPSFGVRIFDPETTRALSGLLMLHDVLNPKAPGAAANQSADKAKAIRAQQVHGGVYDLPWQFDSCVRVAAVLGAGKKPNLLLRRTG